MKRIILLSALISLNVFPMHSQTEHNSSIAEQVQLEIIPTSQAESIDSIAEQIMLERDNQLHELNEKLMKNELELQNLTALLAGSNNTIDRISYLDEHRIKMDERLKILENAPKIRLIHNGQLAFTELLGIESDLNPAILLTNAVKLFTKLGKISNLNSYDSFKIWKNEYEIWYSSQTKDDHMLELVNSSIDLISDVSNNVPLYGPIVQTASAGIVAIMSKVNRRHKSLASQTPEILRLLNITSQFENQKSIIDHEWELINKELTQLNNEYEILLNTQLGYYGIEQLYGKYKIAVDQYEKDMLRNQFRSIINSRINNLDADVNTKGIWTEEVEVYMYRVQSMRLRFGQLTNRMLSCLDNYERLSTFYSNANFPNEFTNEIADIQNDLKLIRENFSKTFKPERYIESSATMYIQKNIGTEVSVSKL